MFKLRAVLSFKHFAVGNGLNIYKRTEDMLHASSDNLSTT